MDAKSDGGGTPSFGEFRRQQREMYARVRQAQAAVVPRPGQSRSDVRAALERELQDRGVTELSPGEIDDIVGILITRSRRFGRLRLVPVGASAVRDVGRSVYELLFSGEREPHWLKTPHGDWGRGQEIERPMPVRVFPEATDLSQRIADEAFQEDDGRREFIAWLSCEPADHGRDRVIVHAGKSALGELSEADAVEIGDDVRAMQRNKIHLYADATMTVHDAPVGSPRHAVTIRVNRIKKGSIA